MPRDRTPTGPQPPIPGPSALPTVGARVLAFTVIVVAGLSGLLIGRSLVEIQCHGSCSTPAGFGAIAGGVVGAGGVAIIAVLVLRAMSEWRARS